ncbi:hypothetical protein Agabi119p4_9231 [Agaricus bisporus var. burnettii]|uniref:Uncharacterized protein n=1 Tax=Agaricus bisporus var. burnettii TaxID=192524 RepID=A0A8H7EXT1_AGABI|nr:hypothetical protein Agabi119p4_9231 [Agaricus bisporus var. burnettii]
MVAGGDSAVRQLYFFPILFLLFLCYNGSSVKSICTAILVFRNTVSLSNVFVGGLILLIGEGHHAVRDHSEPVVERPGIERDALLIRYALIYDREPSSESGRRNRIGME